MARGLRVKATWTAVWPWLAVVVVLGLAKVPAFYLQPDEADSLVIFDDTTADRVRCGDSGSQADGAPVSTRRHAGGSMMPNERRLSGDERARQVLSRDDACAAAVRAGVKGRMVGRDETLTPHDALKGHEPLRKMPPPDRRYWPSPNSQRAPRRPQAKKGSAK